MNVSQSIPLGICDDPDNWNEQGGITLNIPDWDERKVTFKTYQVSVEYPIDGVTKRMTLNILHEDSEKLFQQIQDSLKQAALAQKDLKIRKALWVQFYELQNHFAWTKYNYAITVHKSQGSTYEHAVVHEWDINTNRNQEEVKKLRYVAATRARQQLFIVNY